MKNVIIIVLGVFAFISCSTKKDYTTLQSGIKFKEVRAAKAADARTTKLGDLVEVSFRAWIVKDSLNLFTDWSSDSTKDIDMFADSYKMDRPLKFVLGNEEFIKGCDEGIVGMKAGSKRSIVIPAKLAYGIEGMGPIPPNSSLKVVIELLEVKDPIVAKMWEVDPNLLKTTKSGLQYAILRDGKGQMVKANEAVSVHYSGYLLDGTKFDSSVERDEPITLIAGAKQVIPGWDEGLMLLKKGSKARFVIPPALAYGDRDLGKIPPNSTLVFDIEVVDEK